MNICSLLSERNFQRDKQSHTIGNACMVIMEIFNKWQIFNYNPELKKIKQEFYHFTVETIYIKLSNLS